MSDCGGRQKGFRQEEKNIPQKTSIALYFLWCPKGSEGINRAVEIPTGVGGKVGQPEAVCGCRRSDYLRLASEVLRGPR